VSDVTTNETARAVELTIDGKPVSALEGETLLEAARRVNVEIPTLCFHDALEPRGACRLCMVEISHQKWPGWKRHVAACVYPVEAKLVVKTSTEAVLQMRRTVLDLLLARCPETEQIAELARAHGIEQTSYKRRDEDDRCILCGICVRICEDVIGASAIGVSGRGAMKKVGPPLGQRLAEDCIGCGACANSCPTNAIAMTEVDGVRTIWGKTFELDTCTQCGGPVMPAEQAAHLSATCSLGPEYFEMCDDCRRKKTFDQFRAVMGR